MSENIIQEQIKLASESLKKRKLFESGWYEQRITELEYELNDL